MVALKSLSKKRDTSLVDVDWGELLEEALFVRIDDKLVDKLVDKKGYFKPCPIKAGDGMVGEGKKKVVY
jgi:hypothetical protein